MGSIPHRRRLSTRAARSWARTAATCRRQVQAEMDQLGVETDGNGWRREGISLLCGSAMPADRLDGAAAADTASSARANRVIAELVPDPKYKRYDIIIRIRRSAERIGGSRQGTVRSDGRGQDPYLIHTVNGVEYRTKISTLRGDYRKPDGTIGNRLRLWEKHDFKPTARRHLPGATLRNPVDAPKEKRKEHSTTSSVPSQQMTGARAYRRGVRRASILPSGRRRDGSGHAHRARWTTPTSRFRERGWTHWHHLFNPRQLLVLGLIDAARYEPSRRFQVRFVQQVLQLECRA